MRALACGARPPGAWELATQLAPTIDSSSSPRRPRTSSTPGVRNSTNRSCATTPVLRSMRQRAQPPTARAQMWEAPLPRARPRDAGRHRLDDGPRHRGRATARALLCGAPARRLARDHPRDGLRPAAPDDAARARRQQRVSRVLGHHAPVPAAPRGRRARDRADRAAVAAPPLGHVEARRRRGARRPRGGARSLPPTVAVRRRQLKSGVGADGLLLEQSDVSSVANLGVNRLFRCVRVEAASAVTVHRAMLALRQRYPAAGFVQSLPDFARTLLRTRRPAAVAPPPAAAAIATDDGLPATPARTGTASPETTRYRRGSAPRRARRARRRPRRRRCSLRLPPPRTLVGARTAQFRRAIPPRTWRAIRRRPRPPSRRHSTKTPSRPAVARPAGGGREPGALPGATQGRGGGPSAVTPNFPAQVVRRTLGEVAAAGRVVLLEKLADFRGVEINERCDLDAAPLHNALHCAAEGGHADCVRLLLKRGAWAYVPTHGGRSALHLAAAGGSEAHAECARALIAYGAEVAATDLAGHTALSLANTAPEPACAPPRGVREEELRARASTSHRRRSSAWRSCPPAAAGP